MKDYTNLMKSPMPLRGNPEKRPYYTEEEMAARHNAAQLAYRDTYGPRFKPVHLLWRYIEREAEGYNFSPKRWLNVNLSLRDAVTVFATVDDEYDVVFDGWMRHISLPLMVRPGPEMGTYIYTGALNPMRSFDPRDWVPNE